MTATFLPPSGTTKLQIWLLSAGPPKSVVSIAAIVPGYEKIGDIDRTKEEFQIRGRTFHEPLFATGDGKCHLQIHALPELRGGGETLRLMTVRSEGQFNTVVYEDDDLYRGVEGRDVVLVHPKDIERLSLKADQRVTVRSHVGRLDNIRVVGFDRIKPGNALMYFPEANVLVDRTIEPESKTPAFKGGVITLEV